MTQDSCYVRPFDTKGRTLQDIFAHPDNLTERLPLLVLTPARVQHVRGLGDHKALQTK